MGVDTLGKLKGNIEPEKILNFIKFKYDKNATSDVKTQKYKPFRELSFVKERYGDSTYWECTSGTIHFKDGEDTRTLFYSYNNMNSYENIEFYAQNGLEEMVKSETTCISLGCWGNSVDIIKSIVTEFGGWIDENDCDDKEYYPILKDSNGKIKPVIYITMEDIYKKFGGVVIIKKEA